MALNPSDDKTQRRGANGQMQTAAAPRLKPRLRVKEREQRRNSYIGYWVAVTHDVAKVAMESGNAPRIIQREYLELAIEEEGKRWFNVFPPAPGKKTTALKKAGRK